MRVLQLTKFFAPFRGGIESVVLELVSGLNRRGIPTDVLCAHHEAGPTVRQRGSTGATVTRVRSFGKLLSMSVAPAMLVELARVVGRYDVVHVHLPDPLTNAALYLARPRGRVVVHWHSDIVQQKAALALYRPLQNWLLRRADAIIATSDAYWQTSPHLMPFREKIRTVPIGIRDSYGGMPTQAESTVRRRFSGRTLVFALGRMVYYKGFDHLVEAAELLPADYTVVIGGAGELLEPLRAKVDVKGLRDRVLLVGNLAEEELEAYFRAADIFCLPSTLRSEAFGVVLLEAMSAGKPVVATDIAGSGVPWVNRHGVTGLNVPVADSRALAAALERIGGDKGLAARYGAAARERYLALFTAERMVEAVEGIYESPTTASSNQ